MVDECFRAVVSSRRVMFYPFSFGNTFNDIAVEYTIILANGIYIFVHVLIPLIRRHPVKSVSVKGLLCFLVTKFKVFNRYSRILAAASSLFVALKTPSLIFHLFECHPAII